jgi:hypothetical protein
LHAFVDGSSSGDGRQVVGNPYVIHHSFQKEQCTSASSYPDMVGCQNLVQDKIKRNKDDDHNLDG